MYTGSWYCHSEDLMRKWEISHYNNEAHSALPLTIFKIFFLTSPLDVLLDLSHSNDDFPRGC